MNCAECEGALDTPARKFAKCLACGALNYVGTCALLRPLGAPPIETPRPVRPVEVATEPRKRGRPVGSRVRPKDSTSLQARYLEDGFPRGLTVAEWEGLNGLPRYSVYPDAEKATSWCDRGFYMYSNMSREERARVQATRGRKGASRNPSGRAAGSA